MAKLVYRPAGLDDAALAADLMTAAYPALAQDPVITRYRWESLKRGWKAGRFIAQMDGRPIAFLDWFHAPPNQDPERHSEVSVWLNAAELDLDLLTSMWRWVADQAEAEGAHVLEGYAAEDEAEMLGALARAGFARDRLEKVWELDLQEHGERLRRDAIDARAKAPRAALCS
ncbi:MAG: hypothetical protein ACYDA0_00255 [Candidatus Dormibacteraceae bacterium]